MSRQTGVLLCLLAALAEAVKSFRLEMPRSLQLAKALEHHAHHRRQTTI